MFHSRIDHSAAQPVSETLATMQDSLAVLAAGLDARFVQAGNTLATAVDTIDRVISALDNVVNALDTHAAGAAVETLLEIARRLVELPQAQAERSSGLQRVSRITAHLHEGIMDMHQILRVLHIYGVNIKITASGNVEFVEFVDGIAIRLNIGQQQLEGFLVQLKELATGIANVQRSERLLDSECGKIVSHVPERLIKDATELQAHQARIADLAVQVSGIARDIQGRVGAVLGALQIGDITRQRLEHVVTGLQLLVSRPDQDKEGAITAAAIESRIFRLMAAQLEELSTDFDREARLLVDSIGALGPHTKRLLDLIGSGGSGAESRAFLQRLESGIAEVDHITLQLRDADEESQTMSSAIADTADVLANRLVTIGEVRADVQNMAVNTRLRCKDAGLIGKAVAVIAVEVNDYSKRLDQAALTVANAIGDLGAASTALRRLTGGQLDPRTALATIREGCQRTERGVNGGSDDARQLIDMLTGASDDLASELAICTPFAEAAARLTEMATAETELPEEADPPLRELLMRIGALYTMVSERIVHQRFVLPGMEVDTTEAAIATSDDDLFDDAFF